jgi:hypothetical protein
MAVTVTAGQRHEATQVEAVPGWMGKLAGDKGYTYRRVRRSLRRRGIRAVIPAR